MCCDLCVKWKQLKSFNNGCCVLWLNYAYNYTVATVWHMRTIDAMQTIKMSNPIWFAYILVAMNFCSASLLTCSNTFTRRFGAHKRNFTNKLKFNYIQMFLIHFLNIVTNFHWYLKCKSIEITSWF